MIHRRRRPRVDSCPNFSEDGAIAVPAFSGLGGVHSRNLKRPSLSEKNGRSRTPNSKVSRFLLLEIVLVKFYFIRAVFVN